MLRVSDLRAGYGTAAVLRGVSLSLDAGECVAILGRNGAGKTTLMRAISGTIACTATKLTLDGTDLAPLRPHERARRGLAYVPQGRDIFPKLTVAENLRVGTATSSRSARKSINSRLGEIYDEFPQLAAKRRARGGSLSGGQQQILALARALVCEPKALLLDEPSEGIQPSIRDQIAELIARINTIQKIAVLLVEQNLEFATQVARRALVMQKGEITERLNTTDLKQPTQHLRRSLAL